MKEEQKLILENVIKKYGVLNQLTVSIEELSELTKELCKYQRADIAKNHELIAEEMADVQIMIWQLKMIFDNSKSFDKWVNKKINRIERRMNSGN